MTLPQSHGDTEKITKKLPNSRKCNFIFEIHSCNLWEPAGSGISVLQKQIIIIDEHQLYFFSLNKFAIVLNVSNKPFALSREKMIPVHYNNIIIVNRN